ncbi:MAG: Crp/Fnr family transcriptional regulator [Leptospiraceae bacterium]|nr:Crp/Fnr family transcriptional regulator [Leptospiraceae bacterium]
MIDYNNIISSLTKNIDLGDEEVNFFISHLSLKKFKKNQFLLHSDSICKFDFFITKGLVKEFYVDDKGKEYILKFAKEEQWTCDYNSYFKGEPSKLNIQALENVEAYSIEVKDTESILNRYPILEKSFREYFLETLTALQLRFLESFSKNINERYSVFLINYSDILHRIPQKLIASYLGVSPEFLSKIKKLNLD